MTSPKDTGFEFQPYYGICTFGRAPHTRDVSAAQMSPSSACRMMERPHIAAEHALGRAPFVNNRCYCGVTTTRWACHRSRR